MLGMEERGYQKIAVSNTFEPGKRYMGINTTFSTPEGQLLELQFHTPTSNAINKSTHDMYEAMRVLPKGPEREYLNQQIIKTAAGIPIPPGIKQAVPNFKR
jgi:hypothetical protein